jgi:DNA-binding NarL/FixJ family response regulator
MDGKVKPAKFIESKRFCIFASGTPVDDCLSISSKNIPDAAFGGATYCMSEWAERQLSWKAQIGLFDCESLNDVTQFRNLFPGLLFLWITSTANRIRIRQALDEGIVGVLIKPVTLPELAESLEIVSRGGVYLSFAVRNSIASGSVDLLSPHEWQVLVLAARGLVGKEVAETLNLSLHTVHNHLASIRTKLDVHTTLEAVSKIFIFPERRVEKLKSAR